MRLSRQKSSQILCSDLFKGRWFTIWTDDGKTLPHTDGMSRHHLTTTKWKEKTHSYGVRSNVIPVSVGCRWGWGCGRRSWRRRCKTPAPWARPPSWWRGGRSRSAPGRWRTHAPGPSPSRRRRRTRLLYLRTRDICLSISCSTKETPWIRPEQSHSGSYCQCSHRQNALSQLILVVLMLLKVISQAECWTLPLQNPAIWLAACQLNILGFWTVGRTKQDAKKDVLCGFKNVINYLKFCSVSSTCFIQCNILNN